MDFFSMFMNKYVGIQKTKWNDVMHINIVFSLCCCFFWSQTPFQVSTYRTYLILL